MRNSFSDKVIELAVARDVVIIVLDTKVPVVEDIRLLLACNNPAFAQWCCRVCRHFSFTGSRLQV